MHTDYERFMEFAYEEACASLQEGNSGFGAVIVCGNEVVAKSHDREKTDNDPTSHAELNAIRDASKKKGRDLSGCIVVSTHEPCPMCSSAMVWAGITGIAYGYSIRESMREGRKRIDLPCSEVFVRAHTDIFIVENVLHEKCAALYEDDIRHEIKKIRNTSPAELSAWGAVLRSKRIAWYETHHAELSGGSDVLEAGYRLLLGKMDILPEQAPIVYKDDKRLVFHSANYCPTLEACRVLGYDTRTVCRALSEHATDALLKALDSRLCFRRNYEKIRPYTDYCEEMIILEA